MWKEYILFDEPEKKRRDGQKSEELTFLVETGRHSRNTRPEIKVVIENWFKPALITGLSAMSSVLSQVPRNLMDFGLGRYFSKIILSSR